MVIIGSSVSLTTANDVAQKVPLNTRHEMPVCGNPDGGQATQTWFA